MRFQVASLCPLWALPDKKPDQDWFWSALLGFLSATAGMLQLSTVPPWPETDGLTVLDQVHAD